MMIAVVQRHWLRAHQARPLVPLAARPGSWEVSGHFFVIVPVIYWPRVSKKVVPLPARGSNQPLLHYELTNPAMTV